MLWKSDKLPRQTRRSQDGRWVSCTYHHRITNASDRHRTNLAEGRQRFSDPERLWLNEYEGRLCEE